MLYQNAIHPQLSPWPGLCWFRYWRPTHHLSRPFELCLNQLSLKSKHLLTHALHHLQNTPNYNWQKTVRSPYCKRWPGSIIFLGPLTSSVLHDVAQLLKVSVGFFQVNNQSPFAKPFVIGSNTSSRAESPRSVKVISGTIAQRTLLMSHREKSRHLSPHLYQCRDDITPGYQSRTWATAYARGKLRWSMLHFLQTVCENMTTKLCIIILKHVIVNYDRTSQLFFPCGLCMSQTVSHDIKTIDTWELRFRPTC